jgi:hypothetical protein
MDALTTFGLFAVTMMIVTHALESRSRWFALAFASSCILGAAYGFLHGAWPFGLAEAVWRWSLFTDGGDVWTPSRDHKDAHRESGRSLAC